MCEPALLPLTASRRFSPSELQKKEFATYHHTTECVPASRKRATFAKEAPPLATALRGRVPRASGLGVLRRTSAPRVASARHAEETASTSTLALDGHTSHVVLLAEMVCQRLVRHFQLIVAPDGAAAAGAAGGVGGVDAQHSAAAHIWYAEQRGALSAKATPAPPLHGSRAAGFERFKSERIARSNGVSRMPPRRKPPPSLRSAAPSALDARGSRGRAGHPTHEGAGSGPLEGPLEFWLSKTDRLQHLVYDPVYNRVEVTRYVRQRTRSEGGGALQRSGKETFERIYTYRLWSALVSSWVPAAQRFAESDECVDVRVRSLRSNSRASARRRSNSTPPRSPSLPPPPSTARSLALHPFATGTIGPLSMK